MALTSLEMATKFGDFLAARLDTLNWTQERYAAKVGVTGAFINQIIHGNRHPPLDELDRWASELELVAEEDIKRFRELAYLSRAPEEFANIVQRYRVREREMAARIEAMEKQGEELVNQAIEIKRLKDELAQERKMRLALESRVAEAIRNGYRV